MNDYTSSNHIILASASPRRSQLLSEAGICFEVYPSDAEEDSNPSAEPATLVCANALLKAESVAQKFPTKIVLGADTVVALDGKIFGKPKDEEEAFEILSTLSGKTHSVFTGVALVIQVSPYTCGSCLKRDVRCAESKVHFKKLSPDEIRQYISKVPVLDKAGAYAAQEHGSMIIEKIEGEFDNVMGLPIKLVREILKDFTR